MNLDLPKCSPFDQEKVIRVIGIDPGINFLGISVYEKDLETEECALVWAGTIKSKNFPKIHSELSLNSGERFAKLHGYKCQLVDFFNNWQPDSIICESNYMGSFASAYGALVEIVLIIRIAALDYDENLHVKVIEPSVVKAAIGVSGKSGDKDLIKEAVKKLDIIFHYPKDLDKLDQHAIDAIAIGYWGLTNLEEVV